MFRAAAVLGHPVAQSRSPLVHGHWLRTYGLSGAYLRVDVGPTEFSGFASRLADNGLVGANVTVPHKEAAFRLADDVDDTARALGAVNLLVDDNGRLIGHNTDLDGFLHNLDEGAPGWIGRGATALVMGAGGAARAIVHGLIHRGFGRVVVANRTIAKAEALRDLFGHRVLPISVADANRIAAESDLIVNTTSLGMKGDGMPAVDLSRAPADCVVTDAVYVPLETPFLVAAKAHGLRTVDGLGMLLHQAVPTFERLFGVRPRVTEDLRALAIADIEAR